MLRRSQKRYYDAIHIPNSTPLKSHHAITIAYTLEMIHPFDDIFEYAVLQHQWLFYCHQNFLDFPPNAMIEVGLSKHNNNTNRLAHNMKKNKVH